jgi:hypothetical protein
MSKGKNFTAAEKHFQEKEERLRKELKYWEKRANEQSSRLLTVCEELANARYTIAQQNEWIERLLQYTELDLKDIKAACEKDKKIGQAAGLMVDVYKYLGI